MSKPKSQGFYSKLNEHLAEMDFARQVWALCAPAYCEESRGGRPGIRDPMSRNRDAGKGIGAVSRAYRAVDNATA